MSSSSIRSSGGVALLVFSLICHSNPAFSKSPVTGTGNHGNGVGNTGPGNQGNGPHSGTAGNAGGSHSGGGGGNGGGGNGGGGGGGNGGGNNGGGNNGGGNNGGGNNGGGGNNSTGSSESQPEPNQASNHQLKLDFGPIPYLDFDFGSKLIQQGSAAVPIAAMNEDAPVRLPLADGSDGYRVIEASSWDAGVGVMAFWHYPNPALASFMPLVGLLPMGGKNTITDRFVPSLSAKENLPSMSFPYSAKDLSTWAIQDNLLSRMSGSLLFFGGAALGLGGTASYLANGEWTTYIEKVDANAVLVKISKSTLHSFNMTAGTLISALNVSEFRNADQGFSYRFNLANEEAGKAYEDFVKGNLEPAQKLAALRTGAVRFEMSSQGRNLGRIFHLWLGIPILLNHVSETGTSFEVSDVAYPSEDRKVQTEIGVYTYAHKNRYYFRHNGVTGTFYGARYVETSARGEKQTGSYGKFSWNFEDDHTSPGDARRAIGTLIETTGLEREVAVAFPEADDLGYLNIQLNVLLDETATQQLVNLGASREVESIVVRKGLELSAPLIFKDCQDYQTEFGTEPCVGQQTNQLHFALRKLSAAIQAMSDSRSDNAAFAKAYGEFGKWMLDTKYTFQTVRGLLEARSLQLDYQIQGEKIRKFQRASRIH